MNMSANQTIECQHALIGLKYGDASILTDIISAIIKDDMFHVK